MARYEWQFAAMFHIPPYELGRLTVEQFERGCAQIDHELNS